MRVTPIFLLFLVFLVLKLTHYIDWSWWWIFSPFWIVLIATVLIVTVVEIYRAFFESPERRAARLMRQLARKL